MCTHGSHIEVLMLSFCVLYLMVVYNTRANFDADHTFENGRALLALYPFSSFHTYEAIIGTALHEKNIYLFQSAGSENVNSVRHSCILQGRTRSAHTTHI